MGSEGKFARCLLVGGQVREFRGLCWPSLKRPPGFAEKGLGEEGTNGCESAIRGTL